jgi:hypothetical protein
MRHTELSIPGRTGTGPSLRWPAWLVSAWAAMARDDDRGLGDAHDHAELERRLRRLERGGEERFATLPPGP